VAVAQAVKQIQGPEFNPSTTKTLKTKRKQQQQKR
jgi:hypothetical protein